MPRLVPTFSDVMKYFGCEDNPVSFDELVEFWNSLSELDQNAVKAAVMGYDY